MLEGGSVADLARHAASCRRCGLIEIEACRYWFEQELATLRPDMVVALGATAARAVFGREMAFQRNRGRIMLLGNGPGALITVHPSFLLRLPVEAARAAEYSKFVADLKLVGDISQRCIEQKRGIPVSNKRYLRKPNIMPSHVL